MEESVIQALSKCLSSTDELRISGESFIDSLKQASGFSIILLQISHNPSYPIEIRQLSSIILKNQILKQVKIPESDKVFLKNSLISSLNYSIPEKVRNQYEEIASIISQNEYPWEGINEQIHSYLDSNNPDYIFAALLLLSKISKNYEFIMNDKRNNLKTLIRNFFEKLENLLSRLLAEHDEKSFVYINLILQVYWHSFFIELPPEQATEQRLNAWISKILVVLSVEYEQGLITDHSQQEIKAKTPKNESKKWAGQILYRFFSRYHDINTQIDTNKEISRVFLSNWAVSILQAIISNIFSYEKAFIPDVHLNYYLKYITQSIKCPLTCEYLKTIQSPYSEPVIPSILKKIITPILCKTAHDEEL